MQWSAGLDVAVVLDVDGVPQQGPAVTVVVFHVGAGVEEVAQSGQVFVFDGVVGW